MTTRFWYLYPANSTYQDNMWAYKSCQKLEPNQSFGKRPQFRVAVRRVELLSEPDLLYWHDQWPYCQGHDFMVKDVKHIRQQCQLGGRDIQWTFARQ